LGGKGGQRGGGVPPGGEGKKGSWRYAGGQREGPQYHCRKGGGARDHQIERKKEKRPNDLREERNGVSS